MALNYIHLSPDETPPPLEAWPYRAVLIAEEAVSQDWKNEVSLWLVKTGCLYFIAWGVACERWHDTVDWTALEVFGFGKIPDNKFIMTTWHDNEPVSEALWFAGHCASHPDVDLPDTLIVHISPEERRAATLELYRESQVMGDKA